LSQAMSNPKPKFNISSLIRLAFAAAKLGDEKQARKRWRQAIELGYKENPKTKRGLELSIHLNKPGDPNGNRL
jgi:cytochrome c-type biogenesis protein CcmH/NrfG